MADDNLMDQAEIEALLSQAKAEANTPAKAPPHEPPLPTSGASGQGPEQAAGSPSGTAGAAAQAAGIQSGASPAPVSPEQLSAAVPGDDDRRLGQQDIEKLLSQAGRAPAAAAKKEPAQESSPHLLPGEGQIAERDMELLLSQAEEALASIETASAADLPQGVTAFRLDELRGEPPSAEAASFDLVRDVELEVKIELGRTHMYLEDVLKLRKGSVVPLDKLAGDPVDVYVNGRLVARGEVLVLNDNFCIRVAELVAGTTAPA